MEFSTARDKSFQFRKIHPLLSELLLSIPVLTHPDHLSAEAEARMFPDVTSDPTLESIREEWKAYVEPDLHAAFQESRDVVSSDLKQMKLSRGTFTLKIPLAHAEAWLIALNQARLAIAADFGFDEKILTGTDEPDLTTDAGSKLFRLNLFAFMQECLLARMD